MRPAKTDCIHEISIKSYVDKKQNKLKILEVESNYRSKIYVSD